MSRPKTDSTIATKRSRASGLISGLDKWSRQFSLNNYKQSFLNAVLKSALKQNRADWIVTRSVQLSDMHALQKFEVSESHNGRSAVFHCVDDLQPQMLP